MQHLTEVFIAGNAQSGYAPVNGINMYYETCGEGDGQPLVLIHGGGSTIQSSFGRIIPALSQKRKIIAMELQAHGRTSDRDANESFEQDADDVAALFEYLKLDKAAAFGFSNGGNTALQLAIRHPHIVSKLILGSTIYKREGTPEGFFEGMQQATLQHMPESLQQGFLDVNPDPRQLQNMFEKDRRRMLEFENFSDEALRSVDIPVFVIAADKDVARLQHTLDLYNQFPNPNNRLMIVSGTHGCYIETAESSGGSSAMTNMVVEALEQFLDA